MSKVVERRFNPTWGVCQLVLVDEGGRHALVVPSPGRAAYFNDPMYKPPSVQRALLVPVDTQ